MGRPVGIRSHRTSKLVRSESGRRLAACPTWIRGKGAGQDLRGDIAVELCVGRTIDLIPFPFADEGGHVAGSP